LANSKIIILFCWLDFVIDRFLKRRKIFFFSLASVFICKPSFSPSSSLSSVAVWLSTTTSSSIWSFVNVKPVVGMNTNGTRQNKTSIKNYNSNHTCLTFGLDEKRMRLHMFLVVVVVVIISLSHLKEKQNKIKLDFSPFSFVVGCVNFKWLFNNETKTESKDVQLFLIFFVLLSFFDEEKSSYPIHSLSTMSFRFFFFFFVVVLPNWQHVDIIEEKNTK